MGRVVDNEISYSATWRQLTQSECRYLEVQKQSCKCRFVHPRHSYVTEISFRRVNPPLRATSPGILGKLTTLVLELIELYTSLHFWTHMQRREIFHAWLSPIVIRPRAVGQTVTCLFPDRGIWYCCGLHVRAKKNLFLRKLFNEIFLTTTHRK